jgi:hypothetical protein
MGFFSWECAVSKEDIMNEHTKQGATPCVLVCPDDSIIEENNYNGYGVFGGRDAYSLLAIWNDPKLKNDPENDKKYRDQGINMAFKKHKKQGLEFPLKFVLKKYYTGQKYSELAPSDLADGQGFWASR